MGLDLGGGAHGADVRAVAAVFAQRSVDDVDVALHGDGAFSAFGFASTASDAIGGNLISHVLKSFRFGLIGSKIVYSWRISQSE